MAAPPSRRVHTDIWSDLAEKGEILGARDLWITATALAHGRGLVRIYCCQPSRSQVLRRDSRAQGTDAQELLRSPILTSPYEYPARHWELDDAVGRLAGSIPILTARMSADLHMADELKNTGKGNLFVIFGEPDIEILPPAGDGAEDGRIQVRVNGVDVFHPNTGEVRSDGPEGIACWFIDTDYNEESFFVRQAYFLGANDRYKSLKTTLKAEISQDAWETLHSPISRPFPEPRSGRIAVKVINHLGDEVKRVFRSE